MLMSRDMVVVAGEGRYHVWEKEAVVADEDDADKRSSNDRGDDQDVDDQQE